MSKHYQITIRDPNNWLIVSNHKTPTSNYTFAVRRDGKKWILCHAGFDEGLEMIRQIARQPGTNLEELAEALKVILDPVELMAFMSGFSRSSANRSDKVLTGLKKSRLYGRL